MAVGSGAHDGLGREIAPGTRPVLDHERLPQVLLELAPENSSEHVACPAWREGND